MVHQNKKKIINLNGAAKKRRPDPLYTDMSLNIQKQKTKKNEVMKLRSNVKCTSPGLSIYKDKNRKIDIPPVITNWANKKGRVYSIEQRQGGTIKQSEKWGIDIERLENFKRKMDEIEKKRD